MNGTILVVGGAGYIGSHMVLALQDAGYTVVVLDNLSRGFRDAVAKERLIVGDLLVPSDLDRCFLAHKIDLVMHFAARAYVGESVVEPESYYLNNVTGSLNLLRSMRKHDVNRLVFSSTCAVYGEPVALPISETHPLRPINPYGRSKLAVEQVLRDYATAYGFRSITLRYFNAAGADPMQRAGERHQPETHLIPLALLEAQRVKAGGNPHDTNLTVFGDEFATSDGTCVRDYVHVSDVCRAHLLAARRILSLQGSHAEVFNLANGSGFTVREVIESCRSMSGQPIQYNVGPRRPGDPDRLVGDASLAARELGWEPQIPRLDDMILTAWAWMNRSQGGPRDE